jgi:serine/threonine protein kinase
MTKIQNYDIPNIMGINPKNIVDIQTTTVIKTDSVLQNIGKSFNVTNRLLGKGSYGCVYVAKDEYNNEFAIKCCDVDPTTGIPNILEANIMSCMIHPFINYALRIHASPTKLYLVQDLARTDMHQYTRKEKGNYKPTIEELKSWCSSIAFATLALHNNNIIHADIKSNNVLLYNDGSVKVTDFTLSTRKLHANDTFIHNVCTCTHRPLECFLKKEWNESLDIWSLGCTFYEMAYGELLFPYQGALELETNYHGKNTKEIDQSEAEAKERIKKRFISALCHWGKTYNKQESEELSNVRVDHIEYLPVVLPVEFHHESMKLFNDLLYKMLVVDAKKRLTIQQVVDHPFFENMAKPVYLSIKRPFETLSIPEHARVMRHIQRHTDNKHIQELAVTIYSKCTKLYMTETLKSATCVWLATKLITGSPPKQMQVSLSQILTAERDICHNLSFRLYS